MPGRLSARYEAIIDRTLATRFFPTSSPLGATLLRGGDSLTVIGVVEHARLYNVHQDDRPQVYLPMSSARSARSPGYCGRTAHWRG